MANPQKENGYTTIANELVEVLSKSNFSGTQLRIVLFLMRYTYGFNRKTAKLSNKFISEGTGIHSISVSREVKNLVEQNVLIEAEKPTFNSARVLGVNKNYDSWRNRGELAKQLTGSKNTQLTVSESANRGVSEIVNQERKIYKENYKKEINKSSSPKSIYNMATDDNNNASFSSFYKPSFEEVQQYCAERGGKVDARRFFDYYSGRGWKTGTVPIEDWRAVCRQWEEPKPERKADDSKPAVGQKTNCDQRQYSGEFFESLYKS